MANKYSRENAVKYALQFALTPNPDYYYFSPYVSVGGDCTNFISQCLFAGGAPMSYKNEPWWYRDKKRYSLSWTVANLFYICLIRRGRLNIPGLQGIEVPDINLLEAGDLILYEDESGKVYHSTIVTSFYFGYPLISQHTYNAMNISPVKPHASKMHFIKINVL